MIEQSNYMPEEYRTGHPAIDVQHEVLFVFYHEVLHTLHCGDDSYDLADIFLGLNMYISSHFKFEEDVMLETHYPGKATHFEEHRLLKEQVGVLNGRFVAAINKNEKDKIAHDIVTFLANWLKHHIADIDKQLVYHLNKIPDFP